MSYLRKASLVITSPNAQIDLSLLRFRFAIKHKTTQNPTLGIIRVTNVADGTATKIQKEFTKVTLQAGYQDGPYGLVFNGTITQVMKGRESPVDTYLNLNCIDGDEAYNYANISVTLAAGATPQQEIDACMTVLEPLGITKGTMPDNLDSPKLPRAKVLQGMVRDILRDVASSTNTQWYFANGQLNFVNKELPNSAIVLNAQTGLIGMPEQTIDGIKVRSLLNPNIKPNILIKLNNKDINTLTGPLGGQPGSGFPNYSSTPYLAPLNADGLYRVLAVDHQGDLRGNPWYSDMICLAKDATLIPASALILVPG